MRDRLRCDQPIGHRQAQAADRSLDALSLGGLSSRNRDAARPRHG